MRQAGVGTGTTRPRCPDAGASHSLACAELYTELWRVVRWVFVQLLQGLYDGEGVRQQLHQPQLYVSQGAWMRLQWLISHCRHTLGQTKGR